MCVYVCVHACVRACVHACVSEMKATPCDSVLTLPFSSRFVSMTMVADPCSHTMRQKSGTESGTGP